jgi:hypothetical protein
MSEMEKTGVFDEAISQAWQTARSDLGIQVVARFEVSIGDRKVVVEAFIPDFGGAGGAIVLSRETSDPREALASMGYFASILFPSYRTYSRERFADTLDDWQWFGRPEVKPAWYTGKPWS